MNFRRFQQFLLVGFLCFVAHHSRAAAAPDVNAAIEQHRKGTLIIQTEPGAKVSVQQMRHEFWFGAAIANSVFGGMPESDRERYMAVFLTNFNSAVTENALKWHDMEPRRGKVNYETVNRMLAWTDKNGIPLRGHNIFWGIPNRVQDWLKELPEAELEAALEARAKDIGKRYRGRFAEYDLNNEMIHGNYYEDRLGKGITVQMANWVKQADPHAVLYLNDYDILTGARLNDYLNHIRELLEAGARIDGIGVQGHLHGETFDPAAVHNALQKLSEFRLPIRVTEFNFPGQRSRFLRDRTLRMTDEEEQAKAKAIVDYYRICFAYPQVKGILMWGFWEGANWIPASSMYKRDWTPLPAAQAYQDLIHREWWTKWEGQADANGRCEVRVYYGRHQVKAGPAQAEITLGSAEGKKTVAMIGQVKEGKKP